jgi:hypothetical protein
MKDFRPTESSQESKETSFLSEILWGSTQPQNWEMKAKFRDRVSALPMGMLMCQPHKLEDPGACDHTLVSVCVSGQ